MKPHPKLIKPLIITLAIILVSLIGIYFYIIYDQSQDKSSVKSPTISLQNAQIKDPSEREKRILEGFKIPENTFGNSFKYGLNNEGQTLLIVNQDYVLPFKEVAKFIPISDSKIALLERKVDKQKPSNTYTVFIYNLKSQSSKMVKTQEFDSTNWATLDFAIKDDFLIIADQKNIYKYDLEGYNESILYTAQDPEKDTIRLAKDDDNPGQGLVRIYVSNKKPSNNNQIDLKL